jgi:hypothetical protein
MDGRAGAGIDALTGGKEYLDFDPWAEDVFDTLIVVLPHFP